MHRSPALTVLLALTLVTAVACGSAPRGATTSGEPAGLRASFVIANPAGLVALDEGGRPIGRVADLPANSAPATPVLHPAGKSIAFAITQAPTKPSDFGSDIWTVNLDGTGMKPLVQHEGDTVFYASPRFDPSGNLLFVHRRAALVKNGSFVGNDDSILRIDLRTGERRTLFTDGADPALSPDGRTLVYVHLKDGMGDGLWTAGSDGSGARPLLKTADRFTYVQAPRFDPSGQRIAFSAAGHSASAVDRLLARAAAGGGPLAHLGIPSEIFVVGADGTGLRSVCQTGDDVTPAWAPTGDRIAFIGAGVFSLTTLADGAVKSLAQGNDYLFGDLLWIK